MPVSLPSQPVAKAARRGLPRLPGLCLFALLAPLAATFPAGTARAHGVYIYAWVEGAHICTESYFSKKDNVHGGRVAMLDAGGTVLAEGLGDETGRVCLPLPQKAQDLTFTVMAGQGHRGEYRMEAAEMADAVAARQTAGTTDEPAPSPSEAAPAAPAGPAPLTPLSAPTTAPPAAATASPSRADDGELRRIVREELQAQLGPIRNAVVNLETDANAPRLRDIIGGIGWLVGLAGLWAFAAARRKK